MPQHDQIYQAFQIVLADTYCLYLKTQNYHWNVVGQNFISFHQLFATLYESLIEPIDEIAERIRMLGGYAMGSFKDFSRITTVSEANSKLNGHAMLQDKKISVS